MNRLAFGKITVIAVLLSYIACSPSKPRRLQLDENFDKSVSNQQTLANDSPSCKPLEIEFVEAIYTPILSQNCVDCHNGSVKPQIKGPIFDLEDFPATKQPLSRNQILRLVSEWSTLTNEDGKPSQGKISELKKLLSEEGNHGEEQWIKVPSSAIEQIEEFSKYLESTESCAAPQEGANEKQATTTLLSLETCKPIQKDFLASIGPTVFAKSCISCHGAGQGNLNLGAEKFEGSESQIYKSILSFVHLNQGSKLLEKPFGKQFHGGGQVLTQETKEGEDFQAWTQKLLLAAESVKGKSGILCEWQNE